MIKKYTFSGYMSIVELLINHIYLHLKVSTNIILYKT